MTVSRRLALESLERHDRELADRLTAAQGRVDAATLELERAREMRGGVIGEAMAAGWGLDEGRPGVGVDEAAGCAAAHGGGGEDV